MTNKEREEYAKNFANTNRKFSKTHFPSIKRSLDKVVSSLIGTIKRKGLRQSLVDLQTTLFNDELYKPVEKIYKSVGLYWANQTYKLIRREIAQKALAREDWVRYIMFELEKTLLQYAVVRTSETLRNHLILVLQSAILRELTLDETVEILEKSGFTKMQDRKSTRLNSSHVSESRMPSSA